jgi:ribonuclease G
LSEWLVEDGIGESRAVRIERGRIVAARIRWPGELVSGHIEDAVLVSRAAGSSRGTARFASGEEALVDKLPKSASEGAPIRLEVTRGALGERGRLKRAQARPSDAEPRTLSLADSLVAERHDVRVVHRFPEGDWDELLAEVFAREIAFAGGALVFAPTPAMLVIDIDGTHGPRELALAAIPAFADAVHRFELGGSIGIDFPTLDRKDDRRAVDNALAEALAGWPHERTAMNGFGFVQLVARLERPSLLHRPQTALAARALLRRAEMLEGAGALLLSGHPALEAQLAPWLAELARRTGREVRWESNPALAIASPQAQLMPR